MARIAGVDLPRGKRIEIALTYIYGIGHARATEILEVVWRRSEPENAGPRRRRCESSADGRSRAASRSRVLCGPKCP